MRIVRNDLEILDHADLGQARNICAKDRCSTVIIPGEIMPP